MLELSLLKSFVAIVDHGNFLGAADAVAKSPAAISVHMKKLEESLCNPLFIRDSRGTKLTRHGEKLLPLARRMLSLENGIIQEFNKTPINGAIRLGVPDDVVERFPMRLLASFMTEYSEIKLSIQVGHTPALLEAVDKNKLDLAIITYSEGITGVSETERLTREPEFWAAAKGGLAWERKPLPITLWDKGWPWYKEVIKLLDDAEIEYEIVLECENITGRKAAIEADLAVGPLPSSRFDNKIEVVEKLHHLPPLPQYGLGLKLGSNPSPAVSAIADHIRQNFP